MKKLLVLGAGPLQVPAILTGKRLGLHVTALDGDPKAPGLSLADEAFVVNLLDPEACLAVAQRVRPDGAIHICSEVAMPALGLINETLGLHGPDRSTVVRATNKIHMRRAFEAGGAPSPESIGASTWPEARDALRRIGRPCIVKPSRNSGSRGVTLIHTKDGEDAITCAFDRALRESRDHSVVIEQYVDGPEFSVEILIWNRQSRVLAVTDKVTTGAPHFVETGHSQPTRLDGTCRDRVIQAAVQGVEALGLDWTAAHAEVKLSAGGPYLMEIGARLGGDYITTELVPRSTGVDMVGSAIRLALGEPPDLSSCTRHKGAAIRYLTPPPGIVYAVEGVEEARSLPGVEVIHVAVRPGDLVSEVNSSLTRAGHVIAEGDNAETAIRNAEAACARITIATRPLPAGVSFLGDRQHRRPHPCSTS